MFSRILDIKSIRVFNLMSKRYFISVNISKIEVNNCLDRSYKLLGESVLE